MNFPGGWELVLIVLVIMVLFGAKRLPEASRSLGRSMRIFKAETRGLLDDDEPKTTTTTALTEQTYVPAPVPTPAPIVPPTAVVPPVGEQPRQP